MDARPYIAFSAGCGYGNNMFQEKTVKTGWKCMDYEAEGARWCL